MAGAATESNLKAADLASTSVLFLATHGLVAGEVGDIGEPGLVFTPPTAAAQPTDVWVPGAEARRSATGGGGASCRPAKTAQEGRANGRKPVHNAAHGRRLLLGKKKYRN